jgi:hypothetical protein
MSQHKWAKEIKAWADGAEIERRHRNTNGMWSEWALLVSQEWYEQEWYEYRIKPQLKEPEYLYVFSHITSIGVHFKQHNKLNPNEIYIGKIKLED